MHIAFAICFFIFVGLCETLRHGFFGLTPPETNAITYGALALCALFILRGDIISICRAPRQDIYDRPNLNWSWSRTALGLFLGPVLWIIPLAFGFALIQINTPPVLDMAVLQVLLVQAALIALAEALFFREAAIKAYRDNVNAIFAVSVFALIVFYIPSGLPVALIAGGAGMYFLTLRLIGTNLIATALIQAVTTVGFAQVITMGLTQDQMWLYGAYFFTASAVLSLFVYSLFAPARSEFEYA